MCFVLVDWVHMCVYKCQLVSVRVQNGVWKACGEVCVEQVG